MREIDTTVSRTVTRRDPKHLTASCHPKHKELRFHYDSRAESDQSDDDSEAIIGNILSVGEARLREQLNVVYME
jgi:hypothetical protein